MTDAPTPRSMWEQRYNVDHYHYGTDPNEFLRDSVPLRDLHSRVVAALKPGGMFLLEAYTPSQVGRCTGGPSVPEMTMTLDGLREELAGLDFVHAEELDREVVEGTGHTGIGAVVQVIARKPI